jgi:hypothetical protein
MGASFFLSFFSLTDVRTYSSVDDSVAGAVCGITPCNGCTRKLKPSICSPTHSREIWRQVGEDRWRDEKPAILTHTQSWSVEEWQRKRTPMKMSQGDDQRRPAYLDSMSAFELEVLLLLVHRHSTPQFNTLTEQKNWSRKRKQTEARERKLGYCSYPLTR